MDRKTVIFRCTAFALLGTLLFSIAQFVLTPNMVDPCYPDMHAEQEIYDLDGNILQVLFLGASHVYYGVSPLEIYARHGIVSADYSTAAQHLGVSWYYLQEAMKTQHPQVVVLDVNMLFRNNPGEEYSWSGAIKRLKPSLLKYKMAWEYANLSAFAFEDQMRNFFSMSFPIYEYHDRWQSLSEENFERVNHSMLYAKGQAVCSRSEASSISVETMNAIAYAMQEEPFREIYLFEDGEGALIREEDTMIYAPEINEIEADYLEKIAVLCEENGIKLQLVKIPTLYNPAGINRGWTWQKHELVKNYAYQKSIPFLDLMYDVDLGIDWLTDSVDGGFHLNIRGAKKVSDYLGEYLKNAWQLSPVRNESYEKSLITYNQVIPVAELESESDFLKWIERFQEIPFDKTLLLSAREDIMQGLTEQDIAALHSLGLQSNFSAMTFGDTFLAILEQSNGKTTVPYEAVSNRRLDYRYVLPDGTEVLLCSQGGYQGAFASIQLGEKEMSFPAYGLNFVVYDTNAGKVIDSGCLTIGSGGTHSLLHGDVYQYLRNWEQYCVKSGKLDK